MSTTFDITDINLPAPSSSNISWMLGYVEADQSIIYACNDGKIRKFSLNTRTVVAAVSVPGVLIGYGFSALATNVDANEFVIIDKSNSIFQRWNGQTLTKIQDYWSTFGSSLAAPQNNYVFSQALETVWGVEGSSGPFLVYRYTLGSSTRAAVTGVSLAAASPLAIDSASSFLAYCDGTHLGTFSASTNTAISSVLWSTIATCGAGFAGLAISPQDGAIWATCQGDYFSGHLWKINANTLATLGQCGHHNSFLHLRPDATGIPAPVYASNFTFLSAVLADYVMVGGDGYWDCAIVDADTITAGALTILANNAVGLPINGGGGLFTDNQETCSVVASGSALWSFVNSQGISSTLQITEIGLDFGGLSIIGHGANLNDYDNGGAINPSWPPGNGLLVDVGSLENCRAWSHANSMSVSLCQDSQRTAKDLVDELNTVQNAAAVYSGDTLKFICYDEVSAAGNGEIYIAPTASGPIADLDDRNFAKDGDNPPVTFQRKRRASCDNVVAIEHIERDLDYAHNVTSAPDAMGVALYGPRKGGTLDAADLGVNAPSGSKALLSIHSAVQAQAIGSILAKRGAAGVNEYTFKLTAEWMHLEAMDLVTITDPRLGLVKVPVRITDVKENEDRSLTITADLFVYGLNHPDVQATSAASGTLVNVNVNPGLVNTPIIFEPPADMLPAGSGPEVWMLISGSDQNYGGCLAFVSVDGGATYSPLGNIGPANTGDLTADFPSATDPDTTHTLAVDLSESDGALSTQSTQIADGFADPCYVGGTSGSIDVPFEVVCPTAVTLTSAEHYSLGTYIRRAVQGTAAMDHPTGSRFAAIDSQTFKIALPAQWIGKTVDLKFAAYNKIGTQQNSLADCVAYSFTPTGGTADVYMNGFAASYDELVSVNNSSPNTFSVNGA
jgi:hypothetical protein